MKPTPASTSTVETTTVTWVAAPPSSQPARLLRALGAKIGADVHLHRGVALHQGGWDLLEIGDAAALGRDASLGAGMLKVLLLCRICERR